MNDHSTVLPTFTPSGLQVKVCSVSKQSLSELHLLVSKNAAHIDRFDADASDSIKLNSRISLWSLNFRQKYFAICVGDRCVGSVSLHEQEVRRPAVEIGYWVDEEYWGRGIAPVCVSALCGHALRSMDYKIVWAKIHCENTRSQAVVARVGFTLSSCREPWLRYRWTLG